MASVRRAIAVEIGAQEAFDLWTDLARWPSFVDGFSRVERVDGEWPAEGAEVTWRSVAAGRGRVTERVRESVRGSTFHTEVAEERLTGTQTVGFAEGEDAVEVTLALDYELQAGGALSKVVDFVFIRRAQRDALSRTLSRFAVEAAEQAAL